jgi:hypothetical protein
MLTGDVRNHTSASGFTAFEPSLHLSSKPKWHTQPLTLCGHWISQHHLKTKLLFPSSGDKLSQPDHHLKKRAIKNLLKVTLVG